MRCTLFACFAVMAILRCDLALSQPRLQDAPPAAAPGPDEVRSPEDFITPFIQGDMEQCLSELKLVRADLPQQETVERPEPKLRRVVLAVDSSGSMAARAGGETKIDAARKAALAYLSTVPDDVDVGLVVFGHKGTNKQDGKAVSCAADAAETVYPLGKGRKDALAASVAAIKATGWTPLAAGIDKAAAQFSPSDNAGEQVVYVISDGVETCGGNPVEAARNLHLSAIKGIVNIVGFDIDPKERAALARVAETGGGRYIEARSASDLSRIVQNEIRNTVRATKATIAATTATTRNVIAASAATTKAVICMNRIMTKEVIGVNSALTRETIAGRIDSGFHGQVSQLLNGRHNRIRAALQAYQSAVSAQSGAANEAIEKELEEALKPPRPR